MTKPSPRCHVYYQSDFQHRERSKSFICHQEHDQTQSHLSNMAISPNTNNKQEVYIYINAKYQQLYQLNKKSSHGAKYHRISHKSQNITKRLSITESLIHKQLINTHITSQYQQTNCKRISIHISYIACLLRLDPICTSTELAYYNGSN